MANNGVPLEFVKTRVRMDEDGQLYWLPRPIGSGWNGSLTGKRAEGMNDDGYLFVGLKWQGKTRNLAAHRIVWGLTHGEWPTMHIDHINRIRTDNRPSNLRDVPLQENNQNRSPRDEMGLGVYRSGRRFIAQRKIDGELRYLGTFDDPNEAAQAYWSGVPAPRVRANRKSSAAK